MNRFLISSGNDHGNFYVKDSTKLSYFKNFRKQYDLIHKVSKFGEYFSLHERLYYFQGQHYISKIYDKKVTNFSLTGDIIRDRHYNTLTKNVKLYWNKNSEQAFLSLDKNLYSLEPSKNGDLSTKLLIEGFDFESLGIVVVYSDKQSGKTLLGSRTNGLFVFNQAKFPDFNSRGKDDGNVFYAQLPYQQNRILTTTGIILGQDPVSNRMIEKHLPVIEESQLWR